MTGLDQFSHELGDAFQIFCCRGGAGSLALEAPTAHGLLVLRQQHDLGPSGRGVVSRSERGVAVGAQRRQEQ